MDQEQKKMEDFTDDLNHFLCHPNELMNDESETFKKMKQKLIDTFLKKED